jgi:hypothetical protein
MKRLDGDPDAAPRIASLEGGRRVGASLQRTLLRDLLVTVIAGAATPYVLMAVWGSVRASMRGRSDRITAFLAPGLHRPRYDFGLLAIDAAVGVLLGAVLGALIARFTRIGRWTLWLAFAAVFLVSAFAVPGSEGFAARLGVLVRQPIVLFVLCGAGLGIGVGPRSGTAPATR